ncbi:hypothetical protein HYN86_09170 [Flavobacterium fluviale]|uniref:Uncharacterized protein n=1 Tax=Flavobacterium fluviale TaxID=2249356 RepID=A0A344LS68_9FLAO|nr:hypothetical protein HYN86_09170 [Flavobacterium fluviale]
MLTLKFSKILSFSFSCSSFAIVSLSAFGNLEMLSFILANTSLKVKEVSTTLLIFVESLFFIPNLNIGDISKP